MDEILSLRVPGTLYYDSQPMGNLRSDYSFVGVLLIVACSILTCSVYYFKSRKIKHTKPQSIV